MQQGTDLYVRDADGLNAMSIAAKHGDVGVVRLLIDNGMDTDIQDEIGWTPLHHACYTGSAAAVTFLLESGAHINAQNKNGEAPLHLAFGNGHMEVIRLLIQVRGCRYHPRLVAVWHDFPSAGCLALEFVDMPCDVQADPPADRQLKDAIGFTPLQYATLELSERMNNAGWEEEDEEGEGGAKDGAGPPAKKCSIM